MKRWYGPLFYRPWAQFAFTVSFHIIFPSIGLLVLALYDFRRNPLTALPTAQRHRPALRFQAACGAVLFVWRHPRAAPAVHCAKIKTSVQNN